MNLFQGILVPYSVSLCAGSLLWSYSFAAFQNIGVNLCASFWNNCLKAAFTSIYDNLYVYF